MNLRAKIIAILFTVFIVFGAVSFGVQEFVISPSFENLEREEAAKNMQRAVQAIEREIHHLGVSVGDWAFWTETYDFIAGDAPDYLDDNLSPVVSSFQSLNVHLIQYYDTLGGLVWGRAVDLEAGEEMDIPEFAPGALSPGNRLISHDSKDSVVSGIFMTKRGPMLLVSKPILTSDHVGPPRGAVVMGRLFDQSAIDNVAGQARVDLKVTPINAANESRLEALNKITAESPIYMQPRDGVLSAFSTMDSVQGLPALLLNVDTPREITARGAVAARYALLSLLGISLLVILALLVAIQYIVLDPIKRLTEHATLISESEDLLTPLQLNRSDEFGALAHELNGMAKRLSWALSNPMQNSVNSGVPAAAALRKLKTHATVAKAELRGLMQSLLEKPVTELELAIRELVKGGASPQRTRELSAFVIDTGHRIADSIRKALGKIVIINKHVISMEGHLSAPISSPKDTREDFDQNIDGEIEAFSDDPRMPLERTG